MAKAKVPETTTVKRDGDRDIVFKGRQIGQGEHGDDDATIYQTDGGKFVASLATEVRTNYHRFSGVVADDAAGIAAFFTRDLTEGDGRKRVTTTHLNEAGKLAMQDAANVDESFRDKGFEIVE